MKQEGVDGICKKHGANRIHANFELENLEMRDHMGTLLKALFRRTSGTLNYT
jgi:hypothetical protein